VLRSEVKWYVVKCSVGKGWKRGVVGRKYMGGKVVEKRRTWVKTCVQYGGENIRNYIQYFLCFLIFVNCICLACIVVILCVFFYLLCVCCNLYLFVVSYVYLLYFVCIAVLTLNAGLLARSQYPEGPATGHLDTSFFWFSCVYKRMLRWFPSFQVVTTCFSCSPPDLNFLVTFFSYLCTCKLTTATGW